MSRSFGRTFSLLDAMILVASAAAGLAMARAALSLMRRVADPNLGWSVSIVFAALAVTLSLVPLQLLRPYHRRRRLRRQPGVVACGAVLLALVYLLAFWMLSQWSSSMINVRNQEPNVDVINLVFNLLRLNHYSMAVAGAWLALLMSGRWRRPSDWLDRVGRVLGVGWLASPWIATLIEMTS